MVLLRVPGALRYRNRVVRAVDASCKVARGARGLEARDADAPLDLSNLFDAEMVSASSEAFNNIAIHAYAGGPPGGVIIEALLALDHLLLRIEDHGASLDRSAARAPDLDALPESGLGLFIIESFVDLFDYRPGSPNVWLLKKYLPR